MKRLNQLVALVLAVLWIPIAGHCAFENLPGLQFLKCVSTTEQGDCGDNGDSCSQVENPNYKLSDHKIEIPQPVLAILQLLIQDSLRNPVEYQPCAFIDTAPDVSSSWQFSFRTALPPRAPSFVS